MGAGTSAFHELHTLDVAGNRLGRLSRGLGGLYLYHALRHTDLSGNPWEMPPPDVCRQVPGRRLGRDSDSDMTRMPRMLRHRWAGWLGERGGGGCRGSGACWSTWGSCGAASSATR